MTRWRLSALSALLVLLVFHVGSWGADRPSGVKPLCARQVYYSGQVQGVGFRATAVAIARDYPVTGWVKNLADGRVQLVVEGPEEDVRAFLKAIHQHWDKNITREQVEEQPVSGKYQKFEVVY